MVFQNNKIKLERHLLIRGKDRKWWELFLLYPINNSKTHKQMSDTIRKFSHKLNLEQSEAQDIYNYGDVPVISEQREETKLPKILIFDIETSPLMGMFFRIWQQNISATNGALQSEIFFLTWSAKWLFEDGVYSDKLTSQEAINQDDSRIVQSLWDMINEADVILGHNIDKFDVKHFNTRCIRNGLTLPSPYTTIDTLKIARKTFNFPSNKLDYLANILLGERKIPTSFKLWASCMKGCEESLEKMRLYNDQDVIMNEELYLKIRGYMKSHPNLGLYIEDDITRCPTCLSENLSTNGSYKTSTNVYDAIQCNNCGAYSRSRKGNMLTKNSKSYIVSK